MAVLPCNRNSALGQGRNQVSLEKGTVDTIHEFLANKDQGKVLK